MPKKMTLFNLQQAQATVGEEVASLNTSYQSALADTTVSKEKRDGIKSQLVDAQDRFNGLDDAVKTAQVEQRSKFNNAEVNPAQTAKDSKIEAYAGVIKSVMQGQSVDQAQFKSALTAETTAPGGDNNGNGEAFLPINVAADLISEPFSKNPLRDDAAYSQIVNLILPRIAVDYGDGFSAIADGEAAKEIELKGDQVEFGRIKSKVRIGLSETVLAGTHTALVQYTNDALLNGASQYELARAFTTTPAVKEEHMSFYDKTVGIKEVAATDVYLGIKEALADLDDAFTDNAKIYMTKKDYFSIIEKLANGSTTLYGAQPEEVLGAPVVFTSKAVKPVVGDFSQYHANYDPTSSLFELYKDYEKGINYFQVTLYYDAQVKLASAFRIVDVAAAPGE